MRSILGQIDNLTYCHLQGIALIHFILKYFITSVTASPLTPKELNYVDQICNVITQLKKWKTWADIDTVHMHILKTNVISEMLVRII